MTQVVGNSAIASAFTCLVALSFFVIYKPARFFHFAHAATFSCGAYAYLTAYQQFHVPFPVALLTSVIFAAVVGATMDLVVYRTLRRRGADNLVCLLASIGLMVVVESVISLCYGSERRLLQRSSVDSFLILGVSVTWVQAMTIVVAIALVVILLAVSRFNIVGLQLRAIANDRSLANVVGIPTDRLITGAFIVGSGIAGLAGALQGLDSQVHPTMGFRPLLTAVVAVVIGSSGNIGGVVVAAVLLSGIRQAVIWWLGSEWQDAVTVAVLLVYLVFQRQGSIARSYR